MDSYLILIMILIIIVLIALGSTFLAYYKGYCFRLWLFYSFMLTPIALIHSILLKYTDLVKKIKIEKLNTLKNNEIISLKDYDKKINMLNSNIIDINKIRMIITIFVIIFGRIVAINMKIIDLPITSFYYAGRLLGCMYLPPLIFVLLDVAIIIFDNLLLIYAINIKNLVYIIITDLLGVIVYKKLINDKLNKNNTNNILICLINMFIMFIFQIIINYRFNYFSPIFWIAGYLICIMVSTYIEFP